MTDPMPPEPQGYPSYPTQPGGYPPPAWGPPPQGRPGVVTAAGVIAIIQGVIELIAGLFLVSIKSLLKDKDTTLTASDQSFLQGVGVVLLIFAVLLLLGGITVFLHKAWSRILLIVVESVIVVLGVVQLARNGGGTGVIGIALAAVVVGLLMSGSSRAYFARPR